AESVQRLSTQRESRSRPATLHEAGVLGDEELADASGVRLDGRSARASPSTDVPATILRKAVVEGLLVATEVEEIEIRLAAHRGRRALRREEWVQPDIGRDVR